VFRLGGSVFIRKYRTRLTHEKDKRISLFWHIVIDKE
jgi:hypothetical protein